MTWAYEVVDGTRSRPMGYIGTYETRAEAQEARWRQCCMGGYIKRVSIQKEKRTPFPYRAGVWEQSIGLLVWSRHRTQDAARGRAIRYARKQTAPTGGTLSWSGGWSDLEGKIHWVDRDGVEICVTDDDEGVLR